MTAVVELMGNELPFERILLCCDILGYQIKNEMQFMMDLEQALCLDNKKEQMVLALIGDGHQKSILRDQLNRGCDPLPIPSEPCIHRKHKHD